MAFLHPWALLAGIAGIALPVFIHWLTRPRPIRLPLSTIRFVQEIVHQRRARSRLRDFIILALRTLAVALIALVFARPLIGDRPLVSDQDSGEAVRVVLVDISQSMGAVDHGMSLIDRARAAAAEHLENRKGLRSGLILAAARATAALEAPTNNTAPLREELSRARPRPERLDTQAALALASQMLSTNIPAGARRELVIVSDFQRSNWTTVDFTPLPQDVRIQLESVAPSRALSNLAVLRASVAGRTQKGRDARLELEIGNFSPTARDVQAEVRIGDTTTTVSGMCSPQARTLLTSKFTLSAEGWQSGSVRLLGVEDALSPDNARPFVLNVRPVPTFVLLTREPEGPARLSSYFVSRALDPSRPGESLSGVRVIRSDPAQLDREQLSAAEFIVLDHPGRLSQGNVRLLASLLRRGRCALYICGEAADATNLKLLAEAATPDLQMPVEFVPAAARGPRGDLRLADFRRSEPPFSAFGDSVLGAIAPLRFSTALTSKRTSGGLDDEVLAVYSDQSACLVVTTCGQGALAVLNVDLTGSNLPTSSLFVPLIHEMIERLTAGRRPAETGRCGEPVTIYLPAEPGSTGQLRITSEQEGPQAFGELVEESSNVLWRWNAAGGPGIYRVQHRDEVVFSLATAIPDEESQLDAIDPALLKGQTTAGRSIQYRSAQDQQQRDDDQWTWLAVACAICMLGEIVVLRMFRT